ncbi:DUF4214 domain-containing protein [Microvirga subterranea]|uniref:Uncharacterized protein DUF4214 n=1 Tax=Microvirga subterranea TaxID=186651 RepID=A0A370HK30_9HYPH|nr:DUF4214 domain-containing protein [Microvirga subterranea]RDI58525.1 uncharacterized protein DUF4214 [Microvirga subterranea]
MSSHNQALSATGAYAGTVEYYPIYQSSNGTFFISGSPDIDGTIFGSRWAIDQLTFSFPTSGALYGDNYADGRNQTFVPFNAQQQDAVRYALSLVDSYTNLSFVETTETPGDHAVLRFAQTKSRTVESAQGDPPSDLPQAGDVWFGQTNQPFYLTPAKGNWGHATIMHEIGHALGLKHGHQDLNGVDMSEEFGLAVYRPGTPPVPLQHDGQAWSLMTYRSDPLDLKINYEADRFNQPQTYMQNDIAALQFLYGADYTTNSGNTVYSWSKTTGEMFLNGVGQGRPTGKVIFQTIWDGGGIDTYDVRNFSEDVRIDLRPGGFSTFSEKQLANNRPLTDGPSWAPGNIGNALLYQGNEQSLIENALTGRGDDVIVLNSASNYVDAGRGLDAVVLADDMGDYHFSNDGTAFVITKRDGSSQTDVINNVERFAFNGGSYGVVAFDKNGDAGKAYRLYQAAFDRDADPKGLGRWIAALDEDKNTIQGIAKKFLNSKEFKTKFGSISKMPNEKYVDLLYHNMLDRDPDRAGFKNWVNKLEDGRSRESVLVAFAESAEGKALIAPKIDHGIFYI